MSAACSGSGWGALLHVRQACVELGLYLPAAHAVQFAAPVLRRVFVTEPARHVRQAWLEVALYLPAAHVVQCAAPVVLAKEPAAQGEHGWVERALARPAVQFWQEALL